MAGVILGFDPGGKKAFGCCAFESGVGEPRVLGCAVRDHAADAYDWALAITREMEVLAAAVDAPLYWVTNGEREVDRMLRARLKGMPGSTSSVIPVNSLRGACLVQGIMIARLIQRRWPCRVTEAHPVVARRLLCPTDQEVLERLVQQAAAVVTSPAGAEAHIRDAALAAFGAWAMHTCREGWVDLRADCHDERGDNPLERPAEFWTPT